MCSVCMCVYVCMCSVYVCTVPLKCNVPLARSVLLKSRYSMLFSLQVLAQILQESRLTSKT